MCRTPEKTTVPEVNSIALLDCVCGTKAMILFTRYQNEPLTYVGACGNWNSEDDRTCPTGGPDLENCESKEQATKEWNDAIMKSFEGFHGEITFSQ